LIRNHLAVVAVVVLVLH